MTQHKTIILVRSLDSVVTAITAADINIISVNQVIALTPWSSHVNKTVIQHAVNCGCIGFYSEQHAYPSIA